MPTHHIPIDTLLNVFLFLTLLPPTMYPFLYQCLVLMLALLSTVSLGCSVSSLAFSLLLAFLSCSFLLISWKTICFLLNISRSFCFLIVFHFPFLVTPLTLFHPLNSSLLVLVQLSCLPEDLFHLTKTYLSVSILILYYLLTIYII